MPDDQVINQAPNAPEAFAGSVSPGISGPGLSDSGPVRLQDTLKDVVSGAPFSPAIYDLTAVPEENVRASIAKALELGFNAILIDRADDELIGRARALGLILLLNIDVSGTSDPKLIADHPDWFVNSADGVKFVFLSDTDQAVDWWCRRLSGEIRRGVSGFMCHAAADVPAFVWRRIISDVKTKDEALYFFAVTFGSEPQKVTSICDTGFSFSLSSSCWWDFSAGWLNDESDQLARLAPPISLAVAPGAIFPSGERIRRRAMALSAIYAAGWSVPAGFERAADYDLSEYVKELNQLRTSNPILKANRPARVVSSPGAELAIIDRGQSLLLVINPSLITPACLNSVSSIFRPFETGALYFQLGAEKTPINLDLMTLEPAASEIFVVRSDEPIFETEMTSPDCAAPRLAIENILPKVDQGEFPVRRIVGDILTIEADILADGHDKLAAEIIFKPVTEKDWQAQPMELLGNDRWQGKIKLQRLGRYCYAVRAWKDAYATFADELTKKYQAGRDIHIELLEGLALIEKTATANLNGSSKFLTSILADANGATDDRKREIVLSKSVANWMRLGDLKEFLVQSTTVIVDSERIASRFSSWYEVFPRSMSGDPDRHGTFLDTIEQLPRIAAMGFDVLYFPPIHPIGRVNRKGRNNTLTPAQTDPGSPYAIGNEHGGHDAIHPELGTFEDFQTLRHAAHEHGIEIALDFAIQCAPDHPWLTQHKEWFDWRPDGSIKYAENPPKKYEDIVNVDFYAEGAKPALWIALRDIVQFWVDEGIKTFRVDNPHTKPFPFWEWMIGDIRRRHPEVIFLAEAFTRPKLMYRLAKIGFSQSYTYFTWRNSKTELTEYLTELTQTGVAEFFRPHFFVNTPDINPVFLQQSGRPGFLIRAVLAATLSGLWGVYNGFELCDAAAIPGKEEYLDSEKYQIRVWDYNNARNIIDEVRQLNKIRRANTALQSHLGIEFHNANDDQVLFFSKFAPDQNAILVAISLDPFNTHQTTLELPLERLGLPDDGSLIAIDLMRDYQFTWYGKYQPVILHPDQPFCIWRVQSASL